MTAIAATEIDVLDFEPAGSRFLWERAVRDVRGPTSLTVGDLRLARAPFPFGEEVPSLGEPQETGRDVVVVVTGRTLTVPRAVLVAAGCEANLPSYLVLEQDGPLVEVLVTVLDEVWSRVPSLNASEVEAARGALVALTAGVIRACSGPAAPRSGWPALRAQMDEWIDDNLRNGPIHVEDLAAAHNVSARTINRVFSSTGETMSAVVRARRLTAVRDDLVHTDLTIAALAQRWSYYDPSHLGREFRRHFGVSPSEYRESHGCCPSGRGAR
ncbi:AraC family transcriptional regulator [Nocardioides immobilis]|uniref:AraC family transcriptional regulator n=1 Tax=Nocardioides immobilis TaxID=2049295 RepID=A0A417XTV2_9ACTN|nr:helix-turn-helix transcriptional regulator [Nocardioides immobilis]RHW23924.1 AraC family transcriptional regulator [Nocardioides immobilis]